VREVSWAPAGGRWVSWAPAGGRWVHRPPATHRQMRPAPLRRSPTPPRAGSLTRALPYRWTQPQ